MSLTVSADIGGTNTRFILVSASTNQVIFSQKYRNEDFPTFLEVLKRFLWEDAKLKVPPITACFAVAGPVKENKVVFTNRSSWSIDGDEIGKQLNIQKVRLINDFLAVGYGLLTLDEKTECICLQEGERKSSSPIACIGAGTGLGECFLTPVDGTYHCFPSEGGHAEFAPRNDLEIELLQYLKHKFEQKHRISVERVVSGTGLVNIYEFLSTKFPTKIDQDVHAKIIAAGDLKGAVIASNCQNELCQQTMEIFASSYGSEAGVAALKWLPFGGLYLTGGLTPKNIEWIRKPDGYFLKAFYDKGRVSGLLSSIPLYAVMVENLGERGAQYFANEMLKQLGTSAPTTLQVTSGTNNNLLIVLASILAVGVSFVLSRR